MTRKKRPILERFNEKWTPEPFSGCWLWTGARFTKGYGILLVDRQHKQAHRISWVLHVGPIPEGMCVCHKCDTPSCVNPQHLFVGSNSDNVADRDAKGRQNGPRGEACYRAKLTETEVRQIIASSDSGLALSEKYGVSWKHISRIRRRKCWKHLQISL